MSSIKRLVIGLLLLWPLGLAWAGSPATFIVHGAVVLGNGTNTLSPAATPGEALIFTAVSNKGANDLTLTDTNGTPLRAQSCANGTAVNVETWYECSAKAGAHVLQMTSAGSGSIRYVVNYVIGLKPAADGATGCLDAVATPCATGTAGTTALTSVLTPANEYTYNVANIGSAGVAACSAPSPASYSIFISGGGTVQNCTGHSADIGASTTTQLQITWGASVAWSASLVSFLPAYVNQPQVISRLWDWIGGAVFTLPPVES